MAFPKDTLWKSIIETLIDDFIRYFFPDYVDQIDFERGFEFLDTELEKLIPDNPGKKRHADKLIKVWLLSGVEVWFLAHIEIQGYRDALFAQRMYECIYRIRDKFHCQITGLAIYTDRNRNFHFQEFRETFWGSEVSYKFNTYVLLDHSARELANDPNPFAAVMEAAWQFLNKPKDEQKLAQLKLDMIRRLLKRNLPKDQIKVIIGFIALYVDFENSEINTKFEQDLMVITKATQPMGFEQAIQEEFKKIGIEQGLEIGIEQGIEQGIEKGIEQGIEKGIEQGIEKGIEQGIEKGIEQGEAKRDEALLNHAVPEMLQLGLDAEKIATILTLPLESVKAAIERAAQNSNNTPSDN